MQQFIAAVGTLRPWVSKSCNKVKACRGIEVCSSLPSAVGVGGGGGALRRYQYRGWQVPESILRFASVMMRITERASERASALR